MTAKQVSDKYFEMLVDTAIKNSIFQSAFHQITDAWKIKGPSEFFQKEKSKLGQSISNLYIILCDGFLFLLLSLKVSNQCFKNGGHLLIFEISDDPPQASLSPP